MKTVVLYFQLGAQYMHNIMSRLMEMSSLKFHRLRNIGEIDENPLKNYDKKKSEF